MQLELAAKILVVVTLCGFILLIGYQMNIHSPITGLTVLDDTTTKEPTKPLENTQEQSPEQPIIFLSDQNSTNNSLEQNQIYSGRGGGNQGGEQGYRLINLNQEYSMYYQGVLVSQSDRFEGRVRFQLAVKNSITAEFDIVFDQDKDLANLKTDINAEEKKSFVQFPNILENVDLFVPRSEEDFQIRLCQNKTSLDEINETCDETIGLNDTRASVMADGQFFRIQNVHSKTGAQSIKSTPSAGITLLSPPTIMPTNNTNITFQFRVTNQNNLLNCQLYLDEQLTHIWNNPEQDTTHSYTTANIPIGKHTWQTKCTDQESNQIESQKRELTIFSAARFGGRTTNLAQIPDLTNVTNFTIEGTGKGLIQFDESLDLSQGIDLDSFITIEHNFIRINSEMLPALNKSATLTFFDLNLENVVILRDGEVCEDCQILTNDGDVTVKVPHFSSYTVVSNAQLFIEDTTDSTTAQVNDQIYFYANYSNFTTGAPITDGAYCNITLPQTGPINMSYNGASGVYEYNTSFSNVGTYLFNVQCIGSSIGFADITLNDTFTVSPASSQGVNGATLNAQTPETAPVDAAGSADAYAGNVTEVTISGYSTTQSWQGFYGGVSGTIELTDANDNILYNWTLVEPEGEVYASTTAIISWNNIQCFNFTAAGTYGEESGQGGQTNQNGTNLALLEAQFNIGSADVDGVNETFAELNHDPFFTVGNAFSANECQSTHIFTQSGAVDGTFQEVLLYEPVSSAIVFTSLLESPNATGFNGNEYTFEMLVLEDGHSGDVSTTPYYFWIEIE